MKLVNASAYIFVKFLFDRRETSRAGHVNLLVESDFPRYINFCVCGTTLEGFYECVQFR